MKKLIVTLILLMAGTAWGEDCTIHEYRVVCNSASETEWCKGQWRMQYPKGLANERGKEWSQWVDLRIPGGCGSNGSEEDERRCQKWMDDWASLKRWKSQVDWRRKEHRQFYENCIKRKKAENAWEVVY